MVYIDSEGRLHDRKPLGLGSIVDLFWGLVNFVSLFFKTLVGPVMSASGSTSGSGSSGRRPDGRGPPRPPGGRRRLGGFGPTGGLGGAASPPPMAGGG